MIPIDQAGARYRNALKNLSSAVENRCRIEQNLSRAQATEGNTLEEVNNAVGEMLKPKQAGEKS